MHTIAVLIIKSVIIGILASVPLGPVGVLCIQRTLSRGYLAGFISGMGAAVADGIFAIVAILGLTVIINFIESQQFLMRIAGGAILLIIGTRIFMSNPVKQIRQGRQNRNGYYSDFFSVLLIMLTNPLAVFLFIAAFASLELVSPDPGPVMAGIIVLGILAGASAYWLVLSFVIDHFRNGFRLRILFRINKTAGIIVIASGAAAILSIII